MNQKPNSPRSRYYIFYLDNGEYKFESGDDRLDAQQVLAYYQNRDDVVVLGTYDPQDWYFEWALGEEVQHEHLTQINRITNHLRHQYENRLR